MMKKELKDYLHLYLGCPFIYGEGPKIWDGWSGFEKTDTYYYTDEEQNHIKLGGHHFQVAKIKPILRPLSDMTDEELQECGNMVYDFSDDPELNNHKWQDFEIGLAPEQFHWLLSKHFDLFGLIEAGLAIDSTKTPTP